MHRPSQIFPNITLRTKKSGTKTTNKVGENLGVISISLSRSHERVLFGL